ncbi:murein DD-endopeptidase MepM/ murein hydrolase activator NlpD [Propionibacteriaceae bacterium ES.041]|uniref:M23 family metallopeptidase n=1 Tax=Enemella evansiae TaxID=2016499 RepID=UPI000C01CC40|nr:peptidoglycan DD-metalloendopeptidase family protein [Enemella evansiae]PFG67747.1 murein DD-endopeptidase MepM/ murein hydrolase activator NlpD [Propionibacteriaceae bacterium ES.041]
MLWRTAGGLLVALVLLSGSVRPGRAAGPAPPAVPSGRSPLADAPAPSRDFQPPARRWQAGHRGVDLPGRSGEPVLAAAAGRVSYVGVLAGRGVVVVDHGSVRTTYEPVTARVRVGDRVAAGQVIGELVAGHPGCSAGTCLHWGLKAGEDYLDPMLMIPTPDPGTTGEARVRLLGADAVAEAERRAAERARAQAALAASAGAGGPAPPPGARGLVPPVTGPRTSAFGMRLHPILRVWKLHDGLDFGTGCGAPLRAVADGVVSEAYFNTGYGNRLLIDHQVNGRRLRTAYNHAIRYTVSPGDQVRAGQVIGLSGSTGYSTGCHLHLMLWVDGQLTDPAKWL